MSMCGVCKKDKENMKSPTVCVECAIHRQEYYENNKEKIKKDSKKWESENKEKSASNKKAWRAKNKEKCRANKKKYKYSLKGRYRTAIKTAKKREIEFSLTYEQFASALSQDCIYCNGVFGKVIYGIGLDRIDNTKGYIEGNVVPCCKKCNILKSDWISFDETKAIVQLLLKLRKIK